MKNISKIFQLGEIDSSERPVDFEREFVARYDYVAKRSNGQTVIDIGCGVGFGTSHIARAGAKSVLGTDYSPSAIAAAREKFPLPNLKFEVANALDMSSIKEKFETVVCFETIEHVHEKQAEKLLEEAAGLMHPDGVFYVSTPNKLVTSPGREKPFNPVHFKEYEPDQFRALLKKYFSEVEVLGQKCINENYLEVEKDFRKTWGFKLSSIALRYNFMRKLVIFIPVSLKNRVTGSYKLPKLDVNDFEFSADNLEKAENLFAICRKPKKSADL